MLNLVDRLSNCGDPGFMNRTQDVRANDRATAVIRPVLQGDLAALGDFFAGLSAQTRYLRFFGPVTPNPALLHVLSGAAANVDAVVAIRAGVIVGHAMAGDHPEDHPDARMTDIGVVVADAWQGRGLGSALVSALVAGAQARGVTSLVMDVLHANPRVLAMIKRRWPAAAVGVSRDWRHRPRPASAGSAATALSTARPHSWPGRRSPLGEIAFGTMTAARAGGATASTVSPRDLAAALRAAGLTEVDDSARRRAEYSSDASNYRVVPSVVVFPRHVDEAAAALAVAPRLGVPVTSRGGGTSIAGNAVGTGIVLDFSRHLNRVLVGRSRGADRGRRARRDPGRHHRGRGPARAAVRPRSVHPRAGDHRRLDRQQRLRLAGAAVRPHRRQRGEPGRADRRRGSGSRRGAWAGTAWPPPGPIGAALDALVAAHLGLIRTEFGRFTRQVSGYSLEHLLPENGADLAKFLVGTEGTLGVVAGATVRAGAVAEGGGAGRARLSRHAGGRRRGARPAAAPRRSRSRAWTRGWSRCSAPAAAPRPCPDLPRGAGLAVRRDRGRDRGRGAGRGRAAHRRRRLPRRRWWSPAPRRAALWRIREDGAGLGGRTPAGAPAWPGWEDAAVPPRHLGAYLRDFAALMAEHGLDGLIYGHFGDGCVHVRIDFPFSTAPGRYRAVRRRRGAAGRQVRRLDVRRARRRPGPRRAAARTCTHPRPSRPWPRSRRSSTRATCSTRACSSTRRRSTRTCGCRRPARCAPGSASPIRTTAATCPPRCTAASASASAGPTPPRAAE